MISKVRFKALVQRFTEVVELPSRITTEIYKKILFWGFCHYGDSNDLQNPPNRFVCLLQTLQMPRGIARLGLAPKIDRF